jgi:hypothetical protein
MQKLYYRLFYYFFSKISIEKQKIILFIKKQGAVFAAPELVAKPIIKILCATFL